MTTTTAARLTLRVSPFAPPSRLLLWLCLCASALALLFLSRPVCAAPARVDDRVREDLARAGSACVIITMKDSEQPPLQASAWTARARKLQVLAARLTSRHPGLQVHREYKLFPYVAGTVDAATLAKLSQDPDVVAVSADRRVQASLKEAGPLIGRPQAETAGWTGKGVTIAVLDTGVDYTHPALGGDVTTVYKDVFPGHWAWQQIQAVSEHAIANGYPDGNYLPDNTVTRDQMAVFIARAIAGGDAKVPTAPATASFTDVPTTSWAFKYVEYCKANDLVAGFPDGSYGPTQVVSRGQMAVFIARAAAGGDANVPNGPETPTFSDVASTGTWAWAYKYVEYASGEDVVHGYSDNTYRPEQAVTRDQMAVFISRGFHVSWDGKVIGGFNFMDPAKSADPRDDNLLVGSDYVYGHGTHVSSMAAGADAVNRGIAPGASIVALKVLDKEGSGSISDIVAAIEWCIQNQATYHIRVINMSMGDMSRNTSRVSGDPSSPFDDAVAIATAVKAGILVAVASGNDGQTDGINMPAASADAIAVGATNDGGSDAQPADGVPDWGNRGELIDVYAPGAVITGAKMGGGWDDGDGTSYATPMVAGAAALLYEAGIHDPVQIRRRLKTSGVQVVDPTTRVATPRIALVRALDPPTSGPDLTVTSVTWTTTDFTVGEPVSASFTVKNAGDQAAPACTAVVVLTANSIASPQDPLVTTVSVPALAAGAQQTLSAGGLVPTTPSGLYHLGAFVDSTYTVPEPYETNNGYADPGTVGVKLPSAQVTASTIPASMQAGGSYPLRITMLNDGSVTWTPGQFALASLPGGPATPWSSQRVPLSTSVLPGGSYTFDFTVTAPDSPGTYPCFWQMVRGSDAYFGEVATGAAKTLLRDDAVNGQGWASVSGDRVAFMDFSDPNRDLVVVRDLTTSTDLMLPDDLKVPAGAADSPFEWFSDPYTNHLYPSLSGNWLAWIADDKLIQNPADATQWIGLPQIVAYNLQTPGTLPIAVTWQAADAWNPCVDDHYVVWEDYRNDPDKVRSDNPDAFLDDNSDIYIYDLSDTDGLNPDRSVKSDHVHALCTAPGPQFSPRISGHYVIWEDWRDLLYGQLYLYDLSLCSNGVTDAQGHPVPNWKQSADTRPNPDPAERQLTSSLWDHEYPAISGHTAVWMDLREMGTPGGSVDIYAMDLDTKVETPIAVGPALYRQWPRIAGTQVVWEDWRSGLGTIYWTDLTSGLVVPLSGTSVPAADPDISGTRVVYSQYRARYQDNTRDVNNIWSQKLLPYVTVTQ